MIKLLTSFVGGALCAAGLFAAVGPDAGVALVLGLAVLAGALGPRRGVALALLLSAAPVHAAQSLPYPLPCPDARRCEAGEPGQWVPNWWVRDVAADTAARDALQAELALAAEQQAALKRALRAQEQQVDSLEAEVALGTHRRAATELELERVKEQRARRTRWAVAATVVAVAAGAALAVWRR